MIAITGVSILAGITIYLVSQQSRRGKSDAELLAELEAQVAAPVGPEVDTT